MSQRPIIYQIFTRLFGNTCTTNKPWGSIEENGVGKLDDITSLALKELHKFGITHVWYTGIIEHAVLTDYTDYGITLDDADVVKGRAGSPYAIKDYYDINPDLATFVPQRMAEFESLVERTHDEGLKVLIDFVPNHVARFYESDSKPMGVEDFGESDNVNAAFDPQNNFYYIPNKPFIVPNDYESLPNEEFPNKDGFYREHPAKATGNDVFSANPSITDWFETVKLNYGVDYLNGHKEYFDPIPDTWLKMKEILLFWAEKGVDGFRCDMAEMVPVAFWHWVTKEVKSKFPNITFIAETYNPQQYRDYLFHGGIDYLYDKVDLYDVLKDIIQGNKTTDTITQVWQSQDGIVDRMLRFLENHDEQRIASPYFAGDMLKGLPMMAGTALMHKGPVMMYFGQEVGEPAKGATGFSGDDGRTTIFDYYGVPEHQKWVNHGKFDGKKLSPAQRHLRAAYKEILRACNEHVAFREGAFYDLHYFNRNKQYTGYSDKIYVFVRHHQSEVLLVAINFGEDAETISIKIPDVAWGQYGLHSEKIVVRRVDEIIIDKSTTYHYDQPSELVLYIPAMKHQIYELAEVNE